MCLVPTRPIMASTSGLGSKGRSQGRRGQRQRAVGHRLPLSPDTSAIYV